MSAKSEDARGAASGRQSPKSGSEGSTARRRSAAAVEGGTQRYLLAPASPDLSADDLLGLAREVDGLEVVRRLDGLAGQCPPVVVVRLPAEGLEALRRSLGAAVLVEADMPLQAAAPERARRSVGEVIAPVPLGASRAVTIQLRGEGQQAVDGAEVHLVAERWTAQGRSGADGQAVLTLWGEETDVVTALIVRPRAGYWSKWQDRPALQSEGVNTVTLRPLGGEAERQTGWGQWALGLEDLPGDLRGSGVKLALIDSGVAADHPWLTGIAHGFDASLGAASERSWAEDPLGHGTPAAGVLRGVAPDAEFHVCRLPPDCHCSDLVAALDYCLGAGIDVACVGFGMRGSSLVLEQRLATAASRGMAVVAAAGSGGGQVLAPASSTHVLAVGAIGRSGEFPEDSLHAAYAASGIPLAGGLFVPPFSASGPEIDLCAPGVAVLSCQSPQGVAACDGTSLAAPYVAGLAALVLAHRLDLGRDGGRVRRLYQILKESCRPLGLPASTGRGLPDAAWALGVRQPRRSAPVAMAPEAGLAEMRRAMASAGLAEPATGRELWREPTRGPAATVEDAGAGQSPIEIPSVHMSLGELRGAMSRAGL